MKSGRQPPHEAELNIPPATEPIATIRVFARVLVFVSIISMIAWANLATDAQKLRVRLQRNGQDVHRSPGRRWVMEIGEERALQLVQNAAQFVEHQLYGSPEIPRRTVKTVVLSMEEKMSRPVVTIHGNIHISSSHIENFPGDAVSEMERLIYQAMGHVWLWDGEGRAPMGLLNAMADFLRMSAGIAGNATRIDKGDQGWTTWDEMQGATGRFLQFCESSKAGFVSSLNARLASGWNESVFKDLLGRNVEDAWESYKSWELPLQKDVSCTRTATILTKE